MTEPLTMSRECEMACRDWATWHRNLNASDTAEVKAAVRCFSREIDALRAALAEAEAREVKWLSESLDPAILLKLAEAERLRVLALCLSSSWYYGGWKAETGNEREMQEILESLGYWPTTGVQLVEHRAALDAARQKEEG